MPYTYEYPRPAVTVDVVLFTIRAGELAVLMIRRGGAPFKGQWALPGGFVEYGETLEQTAVRESLEETSLTINNLRLLGCYSDPQRDPRQHTISTVYMARGEGTPRADDDAADLRVFSLSSLPETLCFDHRKILEDYGRLKNMGLI